MARDRTLESHVAIYTWGVIRSVFARLTLTLAQGLIETGFARVSIVCPSRDGETLTPLPRGVEIVPLSGRRLSTSLPSLARYLRTAKPDFLITTPTTSSTVAAAAMGMADGVDTKWIVLQGDTFTSDVAIEHRFSPKMHALIAIAKPAYRRADGIVACSGGVMEILRKENVVRCSAVDVIPNPVDVVSMSAAAMSSGAVHPWIASRETPVATTVARLVPSKNLGLLLDAFAAVRAREQVRLVIFGEGPERARLQERIAQLGLVDSVCLAGYVANPWASLAASDVFVMSSMAESFCLAIVEAMAVGAPIVATDAFGGGPRDILDGGEFGLLVPRDDAAALSTALLSVFRSKERRSLLSRKSRERAQSFLPSEVGGRWLSFLSRSFMD